MIPDGFFGPRDGALVVGHRGAAAAAPENTLPSLRRAVEDGADAVEFDLRATVDRRLVLIHDETVDRTTDGSGAVAEMTLEEIRELDAGHAFTADRSRSHPFRGEGVRVPTLEEALDALGDLPAIVELKSVAAGQRLATWLEDRPDAAERMLVGGFDPEAAGPPSRLARWRGAWEDELVPYVLLGKVGLGALAAPDADALMVPERRGLIRIVTGRFVDRAHRDGLGVHVWTVNRPDRMRALLAMGVDGLLSDAPARVRRILEERAGREAASA